MISNHFKVVLKTLMMFKCVLFFLFSELQIQGSHAEPTTRELWVVYVYCLRIAYFPFEVFKLASTQKLHSVETTTECLKNGLQRHRQVKVNLLSSQHWRTQTQQGLWVSILSLPLSLSFPVLSLCSFEVAAVGEAVFSLGHLTQCEHTQRIYTRPYSLSHSHVSFLCLG